MDFEIVRIYDPGRLGKGFVISILFPSGSETGGCDPLQQLGLETVGNGAIRVHQASVRRLVLIFSQLTFFHFMAPVNSFVTVSVSWVSQDNNKLTVQLFKVQCSHSFLWSAILFKFVVPQGTLVKI